MSLSIYFPKTIRNNECMIVLKFVLNLTFLGWVTIMTYTIDKSKRKCVENNQTIETVCSNRHLITTISNNF